MAHAFRGYGWDRALDRRGGTPWSLPSLKAAGKGRAVHSATGDEDSITMGVEARRGALSGFPARNTTHRIADLRVDPRPRRFADLPNASVIVNASGLSSSHGYARRRRIAACRWSSRA